MANCEEKEYPGSVKGANPEDDPEFYQDWFNRNAPPILVEASQEYQKLQREISGDFETNNQVTETLATLVGSDEPIREYSLNDPLDTMEETQTNLIVKTLTPSNEMDPYPEEDMMEWNQNVEHVERWAIFRMFPIWMNHLSQLEKMQESVRKNETQPKKEIILPSLYRYYNTLPKFARDSEFVKKLVRTFEFTKHNMSIKEKELSLNYICQFTLPMDECIFYL